MSGDWSLLEPEWQPSYRPMQSYETYPRRCAPCDPYRYYHEGPPPPPVSEAYCQPLPPPPPTLSPPQMSCPQYAPQCSPTVPTFPKGENPREIRNKAEKQRRDKLNQSISELASMVPPVMASSRRIDKTGVLRLTAHYLRAHQYVFGDVLGQGGRVLGPATAEALVQLLNGFLLTTTYKGLVVVVSQNVQQYLGYSELDLLGQSILNITHEDDRRMLKEQLMPRSALLGPNGELLVPDDPEAKKKVNESLASERRNFVVRFKKLTQRSEPAQYVTCYVEGSLRKADRASRGYTRCCQMVRRARARADNPCSSGNDVVFIGMVRPNSETFVSERRIEAFRMEYRTRHSVDGEIVQCEQKISLVTGYMTHEVHGLNAMNFMHRNDVRWVIIALREMYDQHRLSGESCYRLMTKNGQFIYMRTRGCLEVDQSSQSVTTFICTNTVVDEVEGKHLIRLMKKKFTMLVNNNQEPPEITEDESKENGKVEVEDPRQLEKVILHLVTDLPSPEPPAGPSGVEADPSPPAAHLNIIPPRRERILSSIEKFYSVINKFEFGHGAQDARTSNDGVASPSDVQPDVVKVDNNEESHSPEAHAINMKRKLGNDMALLNTFEDAFLKTSFDDTHFKDEDAGRFKISDQVLGAVQLECDPTANLTYKRQVRSQDLDENGFLYKRKACEIPEPEFAESEEQEKAPSFEAGNIDSLFGDSGLESALNMMQTMGDTGTSPDVFPDILLDTDFQELFGDVDSAGQDEAASNEPKASF